MAKMDAQDKALQDALAKMDAPSSATPTREARRTPLVPRVMDGAASLRQARIVQPSPSGYFRIVTAGDLEVTAKGDDIGYAVLRAIAIAKTQGENIGVEVFMWRYVVIDESGRVWRGKEVQPHLDAARIALQNKRHGK